MKLSQANKGAHSADGSVASCIVIVLIIGNAQLQFEPATMCALWLETILGKISVCVIDNY